MRREEMDRIVGLELERIPEWTPHTPKLDQSLLRFTYNAHRRHDLSQDPDTPRGTSLQRSISAVASTRPEAAPEYDRRFFEGLPE